MKNILSLILALCLCCNIAVAQNSGSVFADTSAAGVMSVQCCALGIISVVPNFQVKVQMN